MNNLSDGKSDGIILSYCKDGIVYPVSLNKEDLEMLDITLGICLKKIKLINKPMGKAINLLKEV